MRLSDREKGPNLPFGLNEMEEKSNLFPTQTITYIGAMFCLKEGIVRPTSERITKLLLGIENWTCFCLDFPVSTTILDDFLKVSKKELLLPEFDLMVSNEKEGVTELVMFQFTKLTTSS
jgi:hypothetical protein